MALILPAERPSFDIIQDSYTVPAEGPWSKLAEPAVRARLEQVIRATGRLDSPEATTPYLGTVTLVAPDLVVLMSFQATRPDNLFVDFAHEAVPRSDVPRIRIAEILPGKEEDPFRLARLERAPDRPPARMSLRPPAEWTGKDIALIGYPSFDSRNTDSAEQQAIFRNLFQVKRLMPGRVLGVGTSTQRRYPFETLDHDCSTLGGCGGAPLVELETGEVIGFHFAGMYRARNNACPAVRVAQTMNHPLPGPVSVPQPEPESPDLESVGLEASEATVAPLPSTIPATRPALPPTALEGEWAPILRHPQYRPFLDPVVRSVGRLHAWDKTGRTALGTVFVVGPQIVLTSAVDAPLFLSGQGDEVSTLAEVWPFVDFSAALGQREGTVLVRVRKARFVHPFFAVMALELDPLPSSITTLALASSAPSVLAGRTVALVSHDASGLVVQPGQMVQLGRHPQSRAPVLHHDCSAGVEGRGGPIVDLATGTVWAIQCAVTGDAHTLAEPTWELARDPRLWHQPIGFRPDPAPSWMDRWEVSASPETSSLASAATGFSVRIEPGSEPWNSLLGHLNELKLRSSEIVGIADGPVSFGDIESDHSPNEVWQQVLKLASRRGTLGELLTVVMLKFPFHAPALSRFISK